MQKQLTSEQADAIRAKCLEKIDGFLHRDVLREDDVREWLREVVGTHGEAAVWHATRAGGFGGSDIGVLVRNFQNVRADHQASAHDIVAAKLLRSVPGMDTGVLRRGHFMEPIHSGFFCEKWAAVRDEEAFASLTAATGVRVWQRYSPDEMVLIPRDTPNPHLGGRMVDRVLADYKAPTIVDESDEIKFQYACQLHQGATICAHAGIHLDGLMLSQFNWAGWTIKDDFIEYDAELAGQIVRAGDFYWDHVMRGDLPPYVLKEKLHDDAFIRKWAMKAQILACVRAIEAALRARGDVIADEMKAELIKLRMGDSRLEIGDLKISAAKTVNLGEVLKHLTPAEIESLQKGGTLELDEDKVKAALLEKGVDLETVRTRKVDPERAYQLLVSRGLDADSLVVEQPRMTIAKHLKEAAVDTVTKLFPPDAESIPEALVQASNDENGADSDPEGQSDERQAPRMSAA
jgi:hypothetical protein